MNRILFLLFTLCTTFSTVVSANNDWKLESGVWKCEGKNGHIEIKEAHYLNEIAVIYVPKQEKGKFDFKAREYKQGDESIGYDYAGLLNKDCGMGSGGGIPGIPPFGGIEPLQYNYVFYVGSLLTRIEIEEDEFDLRTLKSKASPDQLTLTHSASYNYTPMMRRFVYKETITIPQTGGEGMETIYTYDARERMQVTGDGTELLYDVYPSLLHEHKGHFNARFKGWKNEKGEASKVMSFHPKQPHEVVNYSWSWHTVMVADKCGEAEADDIEGGKGYYGLSIGHKLEDAQLDITNLPVGKYTVQIIYRGDKGLKLEASLCAKETAFSDSKVSDMLCLGRKRSFVSPTGYVERAFATHEGGWNKLEIQDVEVSKEGSDLKLGLRGKSANGSSAKPIIDISDIRLLYNANEPEMYQSSAATTMCYDKENRVRSSKTSADLKDCTRYSFFLIVEKTLMQ